MSSHSTRQRRPAEAQSPAGSAVTLRYHDLTRHSYDSVRERPHTLDWENQPSTSKRYLDLGRQPLPPEMLPGLPPTWELLRRLSSPASLPARSACGLAELAALCYLGYGTTARKAYPGFVSTLRAAPSAGALYPCELYVCLRGVTDLADGVYHYAQADHSLTCLRQGDFLPYLRAASGDAPSLDGADIVLAISTIWWRSSWKYRDRAYRYCLNDTGHLAGNLLLAGRALGYRTAVVYDFLDADVNDLLGLDAGREATLALVACSTGGPSGALPASLPPLAAIRPAHRPLSAQEVAYPTITEAHSATCFSGAAALQEVRGRGRGNEPLPSPYLPAGDLPSFLLPDPAAARSAQPLSETIALRRSSRRFARRPISVEVLSKVLAAAVVAYPSDQAAAVLPDVAVIVNDVTGLPPGGYRYDAAGRRLVQTQVGALRQKVAYLSLEQRLCSDAAASIFFLADLQRGAALGGERSYRRTYIDAGLRGELIYLAGRALGLGCSGIGAFYDDEAASFWDLEPGSRVIYELVVGPETADQGTGGG